MWDDLRFFLEAGIEFESDSLGSIFQQLMRSGTGSAGADPQA